MAAKTVFVEAAIEESIMRENGDADYELSLSDSEEEASTIDLLSMPVQTMNRQTIRESCCCYPQCNLCQQLLSKLQHLVFYRARPSELSRKQN